MYAIKKQRIPANDQQSNATQKVSCVVLRRARWDLKKAASASVLGLFIVGFGGAGVANFPAEEKGSPEPYDIVLNSPAPAERVVKEASDKRGESHLRQKALPPVLEVKVEEPSMNADTADGQAELAKRALAKGELAKAIAFQHRAVEMDPANMFLRLQLAILFDQASDKDGASVLYRQVIEAYESHDKSLPLGIDIAGIKSRLSYLNSIAQK